MVKLTDPIGDFLTRIRNASSVGKKTLLVPHSSFKEDIAHIMLKKGYLEKVEKKEGQLVITLAYRGSVPAISEIKEISKPGVKIYRKSNQIEAPFGGAGITIVSTPQGVMSHIEAKKKGIGGEVIAQIW